MWIEFRLPLYWLTIPNNSHFARADTYSQKANGKVAKEVTSILTPDPSESKYFPSIAVKMLANDIEGNVKVELYDNKPTMLEPLNVIKQALDDEECHSGPTTPLKGLTLLNTDSNGELPQTLKARVLTPIKQAFGSLIGCSVEESLSLTRMSPASRLFEYDINELNNMLSHSIFIEDDDLSDSDSEDNEEINLPQRQPGRPRVFTLPKDDELNSLFDQLNNFKEEA